MSGPALEPPLYDDEQSIIVQQHPDVFERGLWQVDPVTPEIAERYDGSEGADITMEMLDEARSKILSSYYPMWLEYWISAGRIPDPRAVAVHVAYAFWYAGYTSIALPRDRWLALLYRGGYTSDGVPAPPPRRAKRLYRGHTAGAERGLCWTPSVQYAKAIAIDRVEFGTLAGTQDQSPLLSTATVAPERILSEYTQEAHGTSTAYAVDTDGLQIVTTEVDSIRSCRKCTTPALDCANLIIIGETCCPRCDHRT